jgi:hypothetical protein
MEHQWMKEMTPQSTEKKQRTTSQIRKSSIAISPLSISFIKFRDMQKLKKAALAYLATNATGNDIVALKDVFSSIDTNKNGTITLEELDNCLKNCEQEFYF